ncbi:Fur family transcriptional regulator [Brevibacterium album]|uniref:Fur family transcriptional regulator n=1 Tax=Brevibacterium album TaxID=417948 RepID=UPI0003FCDE45|nr:Fur family transcriptional regulator [Brevibacterium album]
MPDQPPRARRRTAQKKAVSEALEAADGFVSAQELHRRLSDDGQTAGLATVYRQLNTLAQDGEAHVVTTPAGQLFRACEAGAHHHHHLICESCGRAVEISPPHEDWLPRVAEDNGFSISHHQMEVFGLCADCRAKSTGA